MAERKLPRRIIDRDISRISPDILGRLAPFANSVEDLLRIPLDFPHCGVHILEARKFARSIINVLTDDYPYRPHLRPILEELEKIDQTITYHDSGYVFNELGILKPEEHHIGSWFIAREMGLSDEICWGILNHQRDKLPEYYPLWLWVVSAADRASGMGFSGALREVYYLGFRHRYFENPFAYSSSLVDLRDGNEIKFQMTTKTVWEFPTHVVEEMVDTDYEAKVKTLFINEVLPNLNRSQRRELGSKFLTHLTRFDGNDEDVTSIIMDAWGVLDFKYFNTLKILEML